jgi:uncharacterized protein involved in cysteine biosynthesis
MNSDFLIQPNNSIQSFFGGSSILTKGLKLCFSNLKLFFFSVLPVMLSFTLLLSTFGWVYSVFFGLLKGSFIPEVGFDFFGGSLLLILLTFALKVVTVLFVILLFYVLLQILYIPFCALIAENILNKKGVVEFKSFTEIMKFNFKMLKIGLLKALLVALVGFLLFLSSFFPIFAFLPLYFGFLILSYDSFDYGLELYGLSLSERKFFLESSFLMINGHGLILFLLSFIPGLVLLTLPFSVAGASYTLGEMYEKQREC